MARLIDTSCWIPALRRGGDPAIRERVRAAIESGEAVWCAPIRVELWMGTRRDEEARVLRAYEEMLPQLPITPEVWQRACILAERCRRRGKTVPSMDAVIAACALVHKVELMHVDAHFEHLLAG
ncbi:MAG: PIN domain-containing protein [Chthoniobacterales bacterium]